MSEKHLVCKGATVYCSKSMSNNNPATAIPLTITSQTTVVINGGKVVATEKDCLVVNMNFGMCNNGSVPPVPCLANVLWSNFYNGAIVTEAGLRLLIEESKGSCLCAGGKIKIAFHGQKATPQKEDIDRVSEEVLCAMLPVKPEVEQEELYIEPSSSSKEVYNIRSIEIIDDKNQPITENFTKFVNLPYEMRFVNGKEIKGLYQLGRNIRCRVKFNGGGVHKFTIKIVPDSNNIEYSNEEKNRNMNFEYIEEEVALETDLNGEKIIEGYTIFLNQAGGNKYHLRAEDNANNIVTSVEINTQRKLYMLEVKMDNLSSVTNSLSIFTEEFKTHFITIEKLAETTTSHIRNISTNKDKNVFLANVKLAIKEYKKMNPYCLVVVYTDHLAVRDENVTIVTGEVRVGADGVKPLRVEIYNEGKAESQALWNNLDALDWYVDCQYLDLTTSKRSKIERNLITLIPDTKYVNICKFVDIDIRGLPEGVGRITLKVNTISRMRGGFSLGENIIAVCTKLSWERVSDAKQNQIMIHEAGHGVGMVPAGKGISPDKPINYYDGHGHIGRHCHAGVSKQTNYIPFIRESTCVMFGAGNGKTAFCPDCANCMRKLDLLNRVYV